MELRRTPGAPRLALALALALSLSLPEPAPAQAPAPGWATLSAELEVDMTAGDGSALVDVRYALGASEPGAPPPLDTPIDLELLGFGEATADHVEVVGERVVLWPTAGSRRAAVIRAPEQLDGDTLVLAFSYRVERAALASGDVELAAHVPILAGPAVLTDAGGPAFTARLSVPERWALSEGFPSGLRESSAGVYHVTLPVVPAVVSFRARTDGSWRPGFPLLVDVLTILILTAFAGFGWRHLRSVAR